MSEIICPYCGTSNSPDADQCRSCHKFLFGEPIVPSTPQSSPDDDWLNSLRGDTHPLPDNESTQTEETPSSEEEIPDWLARIRQRTQEEAPKEQPFEGTEQEEELPDWLKEIHITDQTGAGESQPIEQPLDEIPLPDWLAAAEGPSEPLEDTIPDTLQVTAEPEAEPMPEEGELPEWLSTLPQPSEEEIPADETALPTEETPDWLKSFGSYAGESTPFEESPADTGDDWLKSFESFGEPEPGETESSPFIPSLEAEETSPVEYPAAESLPTSEVEKTDLTGEDWLASLAAEEELPADQTTSEPLSVSGEEWLKSFDAMTEEALPQAETPKLSGEEWLKSFEPLPVEEETHLIQPEEEQPAFEESGPSAEVDSEAPPFDLLFAEELPPLEELESSAAFGIQPEESAIPDDEAVTAPFISDELPDWFADEQLLESLHEGEKMAAEGETSLEPADLPGWLQAMRPLEAVAPGRTGSDADQRVETSGPLTGYQGVLPGEALVTQYSKPGIYSGRLQVLEKQRLYASLLENLVADEKRAQPAPAEKSSAPRLLARILVSMLIVVVVLAFLVGGFTATGLPRLYAPENVAFFTRIQSLSRNTSPTAPILLAVDFEPALAGEIRTAAAPVMQDLLSNNIPLVILSTNPTGAVLAEDLLAEMDGYNPDAVMNIGYLPGGSSALAALASQPRLAAPTDHEGGFAWDRPFLQNVTKLSDFSAVLLLTDNTENSRVFVEQVATALGETPLLVIASNQAAPMIQPYIQSGQVTGMLAGLPGFAAYQQLSGGASLRSGYWNAYQAGLMLIVVMILLSSLFFIGRQLVKPKSEKRN